MMWAIQTGWRFNAVEVVKETDKMVFYIDRSYRERESRQAKGSFLDWRGDEETARQLVAKLTSAKAEYDRRRAAASEWFDQRRAQILASAIDAATAGETTKIGSTVGESAGPKDDAQERSA